VAEGPGRIGRRLLESQGNLRSRASLFAARRIIVTYLRNIAATRKGRIG